MTPDFIALAQQCAPQVSPFTMAAIVRTESGFNPFAIGVVHGRLLRQPANEAEAVATARALARDGWDFSVGLVQVSRANWATYGLDERNAFDPCRNLAAGAAILEGCFERAGSARLNTRPDRQSALRNSLSCYASGNFSAGFRTGYVQRVVANATAVARSSPGSVVVPAIGPIPVVPDGHAEAGTLAQPARIRSGEHALPRPVEVSPATPASAPDDSAVVF